MASLDEMRYRAMRRLAMEKFGLEAMVAISGLDHCTNEADFDATVDKALFGGQENATVLLIRANHGAMELGQTAVVFDAERAMLNFVNGFTYEFSEDVDDVLHVAVAYGGLVLPVEMHGLTSRITNGTSIQISQS